MKNLKFKQSIYVIFISILAVLWASTPAVAQRYLSRNDIYSASSFSLFNAGNLWDAIRRDFKLGHDVEHPYVQAEERWLSSHQQYLDRTANRAAPYLYYIYDQVKRRNLPSELALLPIVESAYNPFARSYKGATGLWQFMPGTAKDYGLKSSVWYDGRRDIVDSTRAALDHLTHLHAEFNGDWLLAIAAYNSGEGMVKSAIERNRRAGKSTDFWSLSLPDQTKHYVPKLIALAKVIKTPDDYNVELSPIRNAPYFAQVDLESSMNLMHAAELAGVEVDQLHVLNPGMNRLASQPKFPTKILIPIKSVNKFTAKLQSNEIELAAPELITETRFEKRVVTNKTTITSKKVVAVKRTNYTIRKGDTIGAIAKRFHVETKTVLQWNKSKSSRHLRPGDRLILWIKH